jgi:hypothetical protein
LRTLEYEDGWTVFYCDPADCTSQALAGAVMAEVARDPDVIALAHEQKAHGQRAGPYLIQVINVGE